jgi:hypothetical protein
LIDMDNILLLIKKELEISWLYELYSQFKYELTIHIDREELKFFSEIIDLDIWRSFNKSKIIDFLNYQEIEHKEIIYYLESGKKLFEKLKKQWNIINNNLPKFEKKFNTLLKLLNNIIIIEEKILNKRVIEKLNKIKKKKFN